MAWIFSLAVECGPEKENAEAVKDHFEMMDMTLLDGKNYKLKCRVEKLGEGNYWAWIIPGDVSQSGVCSIEDADIMTEMAIRLYHHLKDAPEFRYAIAGVEVDDFRTYSELIEDLKEFKDDLISGMVINEDILKEFGIKGEDFCPGYQWAPYEGESFIDPGMAYFPLESNDKLKQIYKDLLN